MVGHNYPFRETPMCYCSIVPYPHLEHDWRPQLVSWTRPCVPGGIPLEFGGQGGFDRPLSNAVVVPPGFSCRHRFGYFCPDYGYCPSHATTAQQNYYQHPSARSRISPQYVYTSQNNMSNNINGIIAGNGLPPGVTASSQQHGQAPQNMQAQQGVAVPQQAKTLARIQGTSPAVLSVVGTGSATTQSVAPQIATVVPSENCDSNAEVLAVFECPVCLEYMLPPYLQCQSGHLVCSNCRPKLQCCPTCRGPTPSVRNLGLEKIANTMRFPCKFASSGCTHIFFHYEKIEHEELCEFRPYCCPCPGASCKWQGALADVMDHLKRVHKSITTLQGEDIVFLATDINLPGAVDWVMMQSCFGYNFMLVLEKQEKYDPSQSQQMFYAVVQLIGSKKEADTFMYRLELSTQRRRMAWEATPRSIHEGVAYAIQQSDCLAFDTNAAQLFAENGNLGINVTISSVENMRSEREQS
ncbi:unnamed protein product [Caenorhabditis auriculariae]|uniref:E3 ubiquitin-protein ligase n=1 Tax=Caenorhabditis auriculariae TaxID=2777116 RepID=A0A8S1HI42_9PELO|nr:unnamed protein product [Caenorhabditis auriculariae]